VKERVAAVSEIDDAAIQTFVANLIISEAVNKQFVRTERIGKFLTVRHLLSSSQCVFL
jgi:hypothetical protein